MTATWNLESADEQVPARLSFYTGPSAKPPHYETYTVSVGNKTRRFNNHFDADEFAHANGVTSWQLTDHNRAFPFAAIIPICFGDAPEHNELSQLVTRFESGESLAELAAAINEEGVPGDSPISPGMLRIWFLGAQPDNPKLAGLRPKRYMGDGQEKG